MEPLHRLLFGSLNHLLAAAPWATERLRAHAGTVLLIAGGPLKLTLQIDGTGSFRAPADDLPPDVSITLPDDFWLQALVDRKNLLAKAKLSGKADVAETLAFVFRNLAWDVEADLASVVGDIAAHRLVGSGRQVLRSMSSHGQRAVEQLTGYLSAEDGLVVDQAQLGAFASSIDALSDELVRLEKRVARL